MYTMTKRTILVNKNGEVILTLNGQVLFLSKGDIINVTDTTGGADNDNKAPRQKIRNFTVIGNSTTEIRRRDGETFYEIIKITVSETS